MHCAFFRADASIATTASYQASFDGFAERGIPQTEVERLLRRSVSLAREARDEVGHGWVAASVGPYGAALANGEEYVGRYGLTVRIVPRHPDLVDSSELGLAAWA